MGILIEPIRRLVNFARWYQEGITGFNRFMDMMELPPAIQEPAEALAPARVQGELELQNVTFSYQDRFGTVFHNLSLKIAVGEYVALVGASGVGKTTLGTLIPRFYDVSAGRICLDGVDIREFSLASLRRNIGTVDQGRVPLRHDRGREYPLRQAGFGGGGNCRGGQESQRA